MAWPSSATRSTCRSPTRAFDRVLTGHFYGHLTGDERTRFLAEARRVAPELVVVDSALHPGAPAEAWEERRLNDGTLHRVYKRHLTPEDLRNELGAEVVQSGTWFVVGLVKGFESRGEQRNPTG